MRYEKLEIAKMGEEVWTLAGVLVRTRRYFQVRSTLLGPCNHRHGSMDAARPCLRKMQRQMSERRKGRA